MDVRIRGYFSKPKGANEEKKKFEKYCYRRMKIDSLNTSSQLTSKLNGKSPKLSTYLLFLQASYATQNFITAHTNMFTTLSH
jgi:hypothetical protein